MKKYFSKKHILYFFALLFILMVGFHYTVVNSDSYAIAVDYSYKNEAILSEIGEVLGHSLSFKKASFGFQGNRKYSNFFLNLHGSRSKGVVQFKLLETNGLWEIKDAHLHIDGGRMVDLK